MAMESACKLRVGRDQHLGKVRMDGDFIDFSGATKYRFRLAEIRNPRLEGEIILFNFHGNRVELSIGEKTATRWIEHILHPRSLADKLDVKPGNIVRILNMDDIELVRSLESRDAKVIHAAAGRCHVVMLSAERPSELRQLSDLSETLEPDGAIWVVLPKSVRTVTKANVFAAAREAGLNHVKAIDYSESQAAYKIVRPDGTKHAAAAVGPPAAIGAPTAKRPTKPAAATG